MINVLKKLPNVTLQYPASPSVVPANFTSKLPKPVQCLVCSLAYPT